MVVRCNVPKPFLATVDYVRVLVAEQVTLNVLAARDATRRYQIRDRFGEGPTGQKPNMPYFDNVGDQRLKQIKNIDSSSNVISQFDYTFNAVGNILSWTQADSGTTNPKRYDLGYDSDDQLRSANLTDTVVGTAIKRRLAAASKPLR
jgi:hypothetical protein